MIRFYSQEFWYQMCGVFPSHQPILQLSIYQLEWGGILQFTSDTNFLELNRPQRLRASLTRLPPFQTPVASHCLLYSWLIGYKLGVPITPSHLMFDNLQEWLTQFRDTPYYYWFVISDTHQQSNGRGAQGKVWGAAWSFHALSRPTTLPPPRCVHQLKPPNLFT